MKIVRGCLEVDPRDAQSSLRVSVVILGTLGLAIGIEALFLGREYYTAPQYQPLLKMPGSPFVWAIAILVASVVILAGTYWCWYRAVAVGLVANAIWAMTAVTGTGFALIDGRPISPLFATALIFIAALHLKYAWVLWTGRNVQLVDIEEVNSGLGPEEP